MSHYLLLVNIFFYHFTFPGFHFVLLLTLISVIIKSASSSLFRFVRDFENLSNKALVGQFVFILGGMCLSAFSAATVSHRLFFNVKTSLGALSQNFVGIELD